MLEFPRVREILAGFASFSASKQMALELQPSTDIEFIRRRLKESGEARRLYALEPDFTIGGATDIRESIRAAAIGKPLDPPLLLEIRYTLEACRNLRRSLARHAEDMPALWAMADPLTDLIDLEKNIAACINISGEVLDTASPHLQTVRQQLKTKRAELMEKLGNIVNARTSQDYLQDALITEREGRYVIPVKAEMRREIKGIVHDVSNTGQTVFIEPWATVEVGNDLRELALDEKREIERILLTLSADISQVQDIIIDNIALVAELDFAFAKGKYANHANATEPEVTGGDNKTPRILRLSQARHPLLKGKAVPLTVELGKDFSILIITGPNTGGKTVALKTIGLLTLMAQSGLPIPAAPESVVPMLDGVFADIGDEQSIEQTLSTFSWHMGNITHIINSITPRSLVLLDELGTATDPAEGSALARAIILHFLNHGALGVITTHFSELKAFAHSTPGLQNASLDFDPQTLAPTYHITVGIPGGSNALATATRLGLAPDIIASAKSMLSQGTQDIEAMLTDMMREKQRVETLRADLERERVREKTLNRQLEEQRNKLKEDEVNVIRAARDRLSQDAADLQRLVRDVTAELKKTRTQENISHARQAVNRLHEKLDEPAYEMPVEMDREHVGIGDTVRITGTAMQGLVTAIFEKDDQIEVQAGPTRFRLNPMSVEKLKQTETPRSSAPMVRITREVRAVAPELDLRGKRAEMIQPMVDAYLNDASVNGVGQVRIIHGFGTGTVRQIVREMLASHPLVKSFRSGGQGEGGDGCTVVKL